MRLHSMHVRLQGARSCMAQAMAAAAHSNTPASLMLLLMCELL